MGIGGWRGAVLSGALCAAIALTTVASAEASSGRATADYPSWAEVQAARGNQAATASTIATISTLLAGLQAEAARLGDEAVRRGSEADLAATALDKATAAARTLRRQADDATIRAHDSARKAGAIVAALYRSGGAALTPATLVSTAGDSSNMLYKLGALDKLGTALDVVLTRASTDRNQATALSQQSDIAQSARHGLSIAARDALAAANSASDAANTAVVGQQANLSLLYAQLASLRNSTIALEQQYAVGQQSANDPGDSGGGGGDAPIDVPSVAVDDPASAKNYAYAILAQNGFGAEQNSCLLWLWNRESGWRINAYNAGSGAYGIPQSLPGSKMASVAADWRTNYVTQVTWGLLYIFGRYDTPCGAWAHSESVGWY